MAAQSADLWTLAALGPFGECENAAFAGKVTTGVATPPRSSFRGASETSEPGISRFRVWSCGPSRNDGRKPHPRRLRLQPLELRQLMPKPGELPLGVMPRIGAADLARLCQRDLALEMPDQRRHAMRLHRRQQRIEVSRGELRDFVQRALLQHRLETLID